MTWVILSTACGILSALMVGIISGIKEYSINEIRDNWIKDNINEISKEIHHFLNIPQEEWDKNIFRTRQNEILNTCYRILKNLGLKNVRVSVYSVSEIEVPPPTSEYAKENHSSTAGKSAESADQLNHSPEKILVREATSEHGFKRSKTELIIKKTDDKYNTFNVLEGENPSQVKRKFCSRLRNYYTDKSNNQIGKKAHWIYSLRIPLKPESLQHNDSDSSFRVLIADTADNRSFPDVAIQLMVFMGQILELTRIHANHSPYDPKAINQAVHKNGLEAKSENKTTVSNHLGVPTNELIQSKIPKLDGC